MNFNQLNKMVGWERQKGMYLIQTAEQLGMDIDGYGELGVNPNSGYTYIWLEDYNFSLYMPINCDLIRQDVYALYSSPETGIEYEIELHYASLEDLEQWATFIEVNEGNEEYENFDGQEFWDEMKK